MQKSRSGEDETKVRSEIVDLVQRRKANCHAPPFTHFPSFWETKRKKPSAAQTGPEWHQCRCYQWSRRLRCRTKFGSRHSDVIGCVRTFRHARIHVRTKSLCLSVGSLVNARPAPFYANSTNDAQRRLTIQGSKAYFLATRLLPPSARASS